MSSLKSVFFLTFVATLLCKQGGNGVLDKIFIKNDIDTSYPSVGNKFQRPVLDGVRWKSLENSIFKSRAANLKDLFRHSVDTIKMKSKNVDIIFLIDSSSSIGKVNFHSEINFVKKLLSHFDLSYNYTRIALITFSSHTKVIRHIDQISSPSENHDQCSAVTDDIPKIEFFGGGTYTYGALKEAQTILSTARPKSRKYIFLVTDGFSNGKNPIPVAEDLKSNNVTIFTIGIQSGNFDELYNISSYPKETHSFLLGSFKEFEKLARGALMQDHKLGYSIKLSNPNRCNVLCKDQQDLNTTSSCCHALANCECRIPSGHYACTCPEGYIGDGLKEDCRPCIHNTYWVNSATCMSCPDINHVTLASPALSVADCICKPGFKRTADNRCEGITCPRLRPPRDGYFVTQPTSCANVLNAACGVRCKSGYHLMGSSLRLCLENGTWSGTEAQCVLKTCPSLVVPSNGMITCQNHDLELTSYDYSPHNDTFMESYFDETKRRTEPMPIDTECSYRCSPGSYIVGSKNRNCLPLSKWDGRQTTCKKVLCPPLPKPKFGNYENEDCTKTKQPYGTNCTLICPEGFTLKGVETRVCSGKKNGFWTPKNKNSKCVDITPPKLICPDNFTATLPADSDSVFVMSQALLPLVAEDSSSSSVNIWTKPSVDYSTGVDLKIGHHNFTYFAADRFNNKAECHFRVTVLDATPPNVETCVDPEEFWISEDNKTTPIEWEEPVFVDNSNEEVQVRVLTALDPRKMETLVVGEYPILYTGVDRTQNYNECLLNITIKELGCDPLPSPQHGVSYCAKKSSHTWCEVTCDQGYAVYDDESGEYLDDFRLFCDLKHPGWKYRAIPDCTRLDLPETAGQSFTIAMDSDNPVCSSRDSQRTFMASLSDQMKAYLCNGQPDCDIISEIPECFEETHNSDDTQLGDRDKYHVSKREIPSNSTRSRKNKKRIRSNVKIRLYTKLSKRLGLWQKNASLSENIRQMKYQVQRFDTNVPLQRVLKDMQIDVKKLKIEEFIRCPDGSVSKKNICVQCARGTYQDAAYNRCKLCPLGTYNPNPGQVMCFRCPRHHNTRREGRFSETDCKALCPPGTWAKTRHGRRGNRPGLTTTHSLMPFCRKCAVGEYQPAYDQTSCRPCPYGFLSPRGSTSLFDCKERKLHICESQPRICGQSGQCIPEVGGADLYSCRCPEGYQGGKCEHKIDLCHSAPCFNNGVCTHLNDTMISCECPAEFTGKFCEDSINSCEMTVCKNGGTCVDADDGEAMCECPSGFEGRLCEETVDYCDSKPCESGICHNQSNGYICICPPGVIGRRCHLRPCDNFPCHKNATCVDLMHMPATRGSYECKCPTGLRGFDCSQVVSPCDAYPCQNNGVCKPVALRGELLPDDIQIEDDLYEKFTCTCPPYFYGDLCEIFTKPDFAMKFAKASTLNYVQMKGPDHDLSELSFCTWIKTDDSFTYGAVLSYATKEHDNAFTLTDYSGFVLYVNGNSSGSDIVANDGEWHFVCASWMSENGYYELFFDGRLEHAGMNLSAGQRIPGKGIFIVGQEQDKLGGGFSESESFIGQIAYLDVWDTIVTANKVQEFYESCDPYRGSLYSWTDFKGNIRGAVEVLPSNFCQNCPRDLHMPNGYVRYIESKAVYHCNPGYIIRGTTNVRHCLRTSKWSYDVPYCEVIDCRHLPPVENGQIDYSSGTTLHSIAEYTCSNGYAVDGNDKRVCLTMGVWSGVEPVCRSSVQCEKLVLPGGMRVVYANDKGTFKFDMDYYPVGVFAEVSCLHTSREQFLTCMDDGDWDGSIPDCSTTTTTELPETTTLTSTTSTTYTTTSSSTSTSEKPYTFGWSMPDIKSVYETDSIEIDEPDQDTTTEILTETTILPSITSTPNSKTLTSAKDLFSKPSVLSTKLENPETTTIEKTTSSLNLPRFPHPDKEFWSLLYEFLYKGCTSESSNEVVLCSHTIKPVQLSNLYTSDQNNFEKFSNVDVQLLALVEQNSADILNEESGVPFEDFFDIILYGKNLANATRMDTDLENALRFALCIFVDAIAWENKFDQAVPVDDATALENRSGILKRLIRQLVGSVYENYRKRFSAIETTTRMTADRMKRSTVQDDDSEETEWIVGGGSFEEPSGCDWSGLPDPPTGGVIVQFLESETVDFGTEIEYGCGFSYKPIGETWVSKCLNNSLWSEVNYECQLYWCDAPPILRNMNVDKKSERYRHGDTVTLGCDQGFYLSKSNNKIECLPNGMWSRILTWCTRVSCEYPKLPKNAKVVNGSSYFFEDTLSIKCGDNLVEITCNSDTNWTPDILEAC